MTNHELNKIVIKIHKKDYLMEEVNTIKKYYKYKNKWILKVEYKRLHITFK